MCERKGIVVGIKRELLVPILPKKVKKVGLNKRFLHLISWDSGYCKRTCQKHKPAPAYRPSQSPAINTSDGGGDLSSATGFNPIYLLVFIFMTKDHCFKIFNVTLFILVFKAIPLPQPLHMLSVASSTPKQILVFLVASLPDSILFNVTTWIALAV